MASGQRDKNRKWRMSRTQEDIIVIPSKIQDPWRIYECCVLSLSYSCAVIRDGVESSVLCYLCGIAVAEEEISCSVATSFSSH